jgi:hypothetical protein
LNIPKLLRGLSRDVVKQAPTLSAEAIAPRKGLIAMLAASGGGFVLMVWVVLRQAWKTAAQDPRQAQKQARLRALLGFRTNQDVAAR